MRHLTFRTRSMSSSHCMNSFPGTVSIEAVMTVFSGQIVAWSGWTSTYTGSFRKFMEAGCPANTREGTSASQCHFFMVGCLESIWARSVCASHGATTRAEDRRVCEPYPPALGSQGLHLVVTSVLRIPVSLRELVIHNAVKPVTNSNHVAPNTSMKIVDRLSP